MRTPGHSSGRVLELILLSQRAERGGVGSERQEELTGAGDEPRPPGGRGLLGPWEECEGERGSVVGREGLLPTESFQSHSVMDRTEIGLRHATRDQGSCLGSPPSLGTLTLEGHRLH